MTKRIALQRRKVLNKYNTEHAVRKGDIAGETGPCKVKGRGRWRTWTPSMMLRSSTHGSSYVGSGCS
jgi:hypothetical protein